MRYKHGYTSSASHVAKEFRAWQSMIDRCTNPSNKSYKNYGGRGITVCDRWLDTFENFLEDIGYAPSKEYSIDRINNNKNYEPSNCQWTTRRKQQRNRRDSIMIGNESLWDICSRVGINYRTVMTRRRRGWSWEDAINIPVRKYSK